MSEQRVSLIEKYNNKDVITQIALVKDQANEASTTAQNAWDNIKAGLEVIATSKEQINEKVEEADKTLARLDSYATDIQYAVDGLNNSVKYTGSTNQQVDGRLGTNKVMYSLESTTDDSESTYIPNEARLRAVRNALQTLIDNLDANTLKLISDATQQVNSDVIFKDSSIQADNVTVLDTINSATGEFENIDVSQTASVSGLVANDSADVPTTTTGTVGTGAVNGTRLQNDLDNYAPMLRLSGIQTVTGTKHNRGGSWVAWQPQPINNKPTTSIATKRDLIADSEGTIILAHRLWSNAAHTSLQSGFVFRATNLDQTVNKEIMLSWTLERATGTFSLYFGPVRVASFTDADFIEG